MLILIKMEAQSWDWFLMVKVNDIKDFDILWLRETYEKHGSRNSSFLEALNFLLIWYFHGKINDIVLEWLSK